MAWPAQGTSVGGWLLRCEEMHSRQGPGQAVRQLLGLRAFCFLSFFFFLSRLGRSRRVWWCLYVALDEFSFVFPWFSAVYREHGVWHILCKDFCLSFLSGEKVCGFFYPRLKTYFPCLASLAARGSHTCTLVQCCPAH